MSVKSFMRKCTVTAAAVLTFGLCLWRMGTVRHPYYEPAMWQYRHLAPVLLLITVVEAILAVEHALEEIYYGEVMRYAETVTVRLDWPALVGILAGCLFSLWWMHVRKLPYIRLIVVGLAALACYLAGFYFTISMDIHISQLYLPVALRGFAYAVLSATFMTCLEEIMTFQHFFQALSVFNMLHMVVGGVMGSALYARGMAWLMPDNIARYGDVLNPVTVTREGVNAGQYMDMLVPSVMEVSIKQIYGWVLYACILLLLLFLFYDAPIRRQFKAMPRWQTLRRNIARSWRL